MAGDHHHLEMSLARTSLAPDLSLVAGLATGGEAALGIKQVKVTFF